MPPNAMQPAVYPGSMRLSRLLASLSILAIPAGSALAQSSVSFTVVAPASGEGEPHCFKQDSGTPSSTALECGGVLVPNGFASATASANSASLSGEANVLLQQAGGGAIDVSASAFSTFTNWVFYNGAINSGDHLVFHFQLSSSGGVTGSNESYGGYGLDLFTNDIAAYHEGYFDVCGCNFSADSSVVQGFNGAWDYIADIGGYASFDYVDYDVIFFANLLLGNEIDGAFGSSSMNGRLLGIDAYDGNNNFLGAASIDEDGHAEIDLETQATPEPASFILVGSGLAFVAIVRRRRKTA
jgi:hypothetical protein